jgi:probable HAF family extracellular repeat protein
LNEAARAQWLITRVSAINDAFQIAGRATYLGESTAEFTQDSEYLYVMNYLDGSLEPLCSAEADGVLLMVTDLNNQGVICGANYSGAHHAFVMYPGDLEPTFLFGADYGSARAINDRGQIVGTHNSKAFRLTPNEDGDLVQDVELGRIQVGRNVPDSAGATGINAGGEICGWASGVSSLKGTSSGPKAFRFTDGTGMVALTTLDSVANGINDRSDVIFYRSNSLETFVRLEEFSGPVTVNLITAGVVQGNVAEVSFWRANDPQVEHINNDRVMSGAFNDYYGVGWVVFTLTPIP